MKFFLIGILGLLLIFSSIFFSLLIFAQEETEKKECPPLGEKPNCNFCSSYSIDQYKCEGSGCGNRVKKRSQTCWDCKICTPKTILDENGCEIWICDCNDYQSDSGCKKWSEWTTVEECNSWERCTGDNDKKTCECSGDCLGLKNLRVTNTNPSNASLPFKLDWEVDYPDYTDHYNLEISNGNSFTTSTTQSEFSLGCQNEEPYFCWLNSNTDYTWKVEACCGNNDCSAKSSNFRTSSNPAQECLDIPKDLKIKDPEENEIIDTSNVQLPIKFDWNEVSHWQDPLGPKSYRIKFKGAPTHQVEKVLPESEYFPSSCTLNSSTTYSWQTQACCTLDGTNCGKWSTSSEFTTSLAPEPMTEDWAKIEFSKVIESEPILQWCPVSQAKSYWITIYEPVFDEWEKLINWQNYDSPDTPEVDSKYIDPEILSAQVLYKWKVATCLKENGLQCGKLCAEDAIGDAPCAEFSKERKFMLRETLLPPKLRAPVYRLDQPIPVVNTEDKLFWETATGTRYYFYQIRDEGNKEVSAHFTTATFVEFEKIWKEGKELKPNTIYKWRVASCQKKEKNTCSDFSEEWKFKTTGVPPQFNQPDSGPEDGAVNLLWPVKLNWDNVRQALSYLYQVSTGADFSETQIVASGKTGKDQSEVEIDYPEIKPNTTYWWRVKSCADREGEVCGDWTEGRIFTTSSLPPPSNLRPANEEEIYLPIKLSWDRVSGTKFYQYEIEYLSLHPEEKRESCSNLVGSSKGKEREIIDGKFSSYLLTFECLGDYQWRIRGCMDEKCEERVSPWTAWHSFTVIPVPILGGIVPCGRSLDNPDTSWNEMEKCQIKHLFILLKIIFDFLLWRAIPIILVLFVVLSGTMFYLSMGASGTLAQIKLMWKKFLIGWAIILFAWLIIHFILIFFGVPIKWWIIEF